jgi:hypothetical protein
MNRQKYIQRLLFALLVILVLACNNSNSDGRQIEASIANLETSISFSGSKYQIDTAMILTNQNLLPLIDDLDKTTLITHTNTKDIPYFIKTFLDSLTGNDFSIANPGEDWQAGCVIIEKLPSRQLVYLGLGNDIALFSYFTGGIGKSVHVLIIKFSDKIITDFWCGNVLVDLNSKSEILEHLKKYKDNNGKLNTNMIYL